MKSREAVLLSWFNEAFNAHDPAGMMALKTDDPSSRIPFLHPQVCGFKARLR